MTTIGIYDISNAGHSEMNLEVYCRVAHAANYNVVVFTTTQTADSVKQQLGAISEEIRWEIKGSAEHLSKYLNRIEPLCDSEVDLFFFASLYPSIKEFVSYLRFSPECEILQQVYNVNRWLKQRLSVDCGPKNNLRHILRQLFFRRTDHVIVEYPPIQEYIERECECPKSVHSFIPVIYNSDGGSVECQKPVFTIPGLVEPTRRDYMGVIDAFEEVMSQAGGDATLHLLGRPTGPSGEEIVSRCENIHSQGYSLISHRDWIPEYEFKQRIAESTFLLAPLQPSINKGCIEEIYGLTKGSGAILNSLRTGKPLILPDHFAVDKCIESSTLVYSGKSDLRDIIKSAINNPELNKNAIQNATENSEKFSLTQQKQRFNSIVEEIV